jgi:hypothetical protein
MLRDTSQTARIVNDRRRGPTPMLSWFTLFGGRRRHSRRGDESSVFVDQHGQGLFLVVTSVVALNVIDAFFTVTSSRTAGPR